MPKLIFERSRSGRSTRYLPACEVPTVELPNSLQRNELPPLPQVSESELSRHFNALEQQVFGVGRGFYPLGSCTMKYNPAVNERSAALSGFAGVHPLQDEGTVQGCLEALCELSDLLTEVTGMDAMTFQPAAGAHGELTGIMLIKAYHESRNDTARDTILVPDTAHGTNPATATMCGMKVTAIPSDERGQVDLEKLAAACGPHIAGIMLTNPNTVGIFEENVEKITNLVHTCGGLCYYDGANLNAIMGIARPGDMGFDVVHLNLHKTFSTPHGGGGPGSGAVGCKALLADFLPSDQPVDEGAFTLTRPATSIGRVKSFYGNFAVNLKALTYLQTLGAEGVREAAQNAVLNANYLKNRLRDGGFTVAFDGTCMHEFVLTLAPQKKAHGVAAMDIAKALLDCGMHPPTMYFPLLVEEALMLEPTETESRESLDEAAKVYIKVLELAATEPETLHAAPVNCPIGRPDEVQAARTPILRYTEDESCST